MTAYTDDDEVTAAAEVIHESWCSTPPACGRTWDTCDEDITFSLRDMPRIVAAVAPVIAKRERERLEAEWAAEVAETKRLLRERTEQAGK